MEKELRVEENSDIWDDSDLQVNEELINYSPISTPKASLQQTSTLAGKLL
jgi:hypothetical protein